MYVWKADLADSVFEWLCDSSDIHCTWMMVHSLYSSSGLAAPLVSMIMRALTGKDSHKYVKVWNVFSYVCFESHTCLSASQFHNWQILNTNQINSTIIKACIWINTFQITIKITKQGRVLFYQYNGLWSTWWSNDMLIPSHAVTGSCKHLSKQCGW